MYMPNQLGASITYNQNSPSLRRLFRRHLYIFCPNFVIEEANDLYSSSHYISSRSDKPNPDMYIPDLRFDATPALELNHLVPAL